MVELHWPRDVCSMLCCAVRCGATNATHRACARGRVAASRPCSGVTGGDAARDRVVAYLLRSKAERLFSSQLCTGVVRMQTPVRFPQTQLERRFTT